MKKMNRKRCTGASTVEYALGLASILVVFLAPITPSGKSVVTTLEEAIKAEYAAYIYAASLSQMPDE